MKKTGRKNKGSSSDLKKQKNKFPPRNQNTASQLNLAFIVKNKNENVYDNSVLSDTFTECHLTVRTLPPLLCTTFDNNRHQQYFKPGREQHCPFASAIVSPPASLELIN